jgi:hypothetical protein
MVDGASRFWLAVCLRFCRVADSDVAPASCVRKGEGKGSHATHLDVVGRSLSVDMARQRTCQVVTVHPLGC